LPLTLLLRCSYPRVSPYGSDSRGYLPYSVSVSRIQLSRCSVVLGGTGTHYSITGMACQRTQSTHIPLPHDRISLHILPKFTTLKSDSEARTQATTHIPPHPHLATTQLPYPHYSNGVTTGKLASHTHAPTHIPTPTSATGYPINPHKSYTFRLVRQPRGSACG